MRGSTRRGVLAAAGALVAGVGAAPAHQAIEAALPLREIARRHGRFYGAATGPRLLDQDPAFARAFAAECGVVVPEGEGKWDAIRPTPDRYDFSGLDRLIAFADAHGMGVRGHCLAWHESNPPWLEEALRAADAAEARRLLEEHVAAVVGHTGGRVGSWDVVNEAVDVEAGPDRLRRSPWYRALGADYIDIAFHAARRADPGVQLVYNEIGTDETDEPSRRKRAATLDLLRGMRAREVPVDALGLQAHLMAGRGIDAGELRSYIQAVAALGLGVIVTELDVWDGPLPTPVEERDRAVGDHVRTYLEAVLAEPAVMGVLTWGLSDRYFWLNTDYAAWARRPDGTPNRGLPLDRDLRRTPMWQAIADALGRR